MTYWVTILAYAGLIVQSVTASVIADDFALQPVYPICAVPTRLSLSAWAVATYRAAVLPRWLGPTLAAGWLLAPPLGPTLATFLTPLAWAAVAFGTLKAAPESATGQSVR